MVYWAASRCYTAVQGGELKLVAIILATTRTSVSKHKGQLSVPACFYREMLCIAPTMLLQVVCPSVRLSVTCRYSIETATNLQRVDAFLRRCKRCSYCPTVRLICQTLTSCWKRLMTGCSARLWTILITHCTHSSHRSPQHRITITSGNAHTTDRQLPAHRGHLLDKLSIVLAVLSMYFIGVSGLRVLPLSINKMENFVARALYKDIYWKPNCLY